MKTLIVLLSTLCCACAMTETELRPEVNQYLRELNAAGLLNPRQKRQTTQVIHRYYVTQCDYNMTEETSPSIEIYADSLHVNAGEVAVIKAARLIHRMVRFMPKEIFDRLTEKSAVGLFDYDSLPAESIPELAVIPKACYANCNRQIQVPVNQTYTETYDCSQWCTNTLYPYYKNFPINYLWAYGNLSRTFVVTNNVMCEGFNPSGGNENYLVREFALSIMTRALSEEQQAEIDGAYQAAVQIWNGLINVYDYFMKGAMIWFNGVSDKADLSGMNCKSPASQSNADLPECSTVYHMRKYLRLRDPQLYEILLHVFNNNRAYLQSYTAVCDW